MVNSNITTMAKALGWSHLEERRNNLRLFIMFEIIHNRNAIPSRNPLVPADRHIWSNHPDTSTHIRANTEKYTSFSLAF